MYDFLVSVANACKEIFIPIFIFLALAYFIMCLKNFSGYMKKRKDLYNMIYNYLDSFLKELNEEYDKIIQNNIKEFPKGGSK